MLERVKGQQPAKYDIEPLIYGLTRVQSDKMEDVNALADPTGPDNTLQPWDKQEGEDIDWYEKFLYYLRLGPDRSLQKALKRWLIERNKLLPGEPAPVHLVYAWSQVSVKEQWLLRAKYWDRINLKELQITIEGERQKRIQDMAEEHLAGWELFQRAAVQSVFQKDDVGTILLDEDGQPRLKEIEDIGTAARVFKQAVQGKRTEMGLANEYLAMKGFELVQRWKDLNMQLQEADETVDGEIRELDLEDESA
jgi:hypothetical protein